MKIDQFEDLIELAIPSLHGIFGELFNAADVTVEETALRPKDGRGLSSDLGGKVAIYAPWLQVTTGAREGRLYYLHRQTWPSSSVLSIRNVQPRFLHIQLTHYIHFNITHRYMSRSCKTAPFCVIWVFHSVVHEDFCDMTLRPVVTSPTFRMILLSSSSQQTKNSPLMIPNKSFSSVSYIPIRATCPTFYIVPDAITITIQGGQNILRSTSFCDNHVSNDTWISPARC